MKKYINQYEKECWSGVELDTEFDTEMFHDGSAAEGDVAFSLFTNLGSLTVLDRMTGWGNGVRDTETGFRKDGKFWLASGMMDVRLSGAKTFGEAIEWVKKNANTCTPKGDDQ